MRIDRVKFAAELARRDMNLVKLGEMSGLSRATLSSVKCGKTCSLNSAERIAKALNVTIEQLIEQEVRP